MPDTLNPRDLVPSYRYYVITKILEGDGAGQTSTYRYEYIRDTRSEHAWKEDASGTTELFIIIGDDQWTYVAGQGWVKRTVDASLKPVNVSTQITQAMKDRAASKARVALKGLQEPINNAYCSHYLVEYTIKQQVPNPSGIGTTEVEAHTIGDVWIGDQLGVPSIVMLWKGTTDYMLQGKKTVVSTEQSLYDIDRVTSIAPPKT